MRRRAAKPLSEQALLERFRRRVALLPTTVFFALELASAWPSKVVDTTSVGFAFFIAVVGAACLYAAIRARQPFLALLCVLFTSAYAPGAGDAVLNGISMQAVSLTPGPASVRAALFVLALFLGTMVAGTIALQPVFDRWLPDGIAGGRLSDRNVRYALLGVLALSFLVALSTGSWTAYGAENTSGSRDGAFRLEFLYDPSLFSMFAVLVMQLKEHYTPGKGTGKSPRWLWLLSAVVFLLMFTRQVRRMMIASIVFAVVAVLDEVPLARRVLRSPARILGGGVAMAALTAGIFIGSTAWRSSAQDFSTSSISARVQDMTSRLGEANSEAVSEQKQRLTYLWLDASAIEYGDLLDGILSIDSMFVRTVIISVPGMLFRSKYLYPLQTCETAFERIGVGSDLPCTSQSEGYLALGIPGVVIVALFWAPVIAFATALFRRNRAFGCLLAMHLVLPLTTLETSAFPAVLSARIALQGGLFVAVVAIALGVVLGNRMRVVSRPRGAPSPGPAVR